MTRFDVILIAVLFIGNVICTTVGVKDIPNLIGRTGLISIVNLMPLPLGGHMNLIASRCGISLEAYVSIHRWLAMAGIVEGLVHTAIAASHLKLNLQVISGVAELTAG